MIDQKTFLREIAILAELFNRPALSEILIARYYDYLSQHLTTPEFEAAAHKILTEDTYWPPPVRFLHAAKGDPQQHARQEWDQLVDEARHGRLAELSDAGKKALRALGGYPAVAYANEAALPSLRRAFLDTYTTRPTEPDEEPVQQLALDTP